MGSGKAWKCLLTLSNGVESWRNRIPLVKYAPLRQAFVGPSYRCAWFFQAVLTRANSKQGQYRKFFLFPKTSVEHRSVLAMKLKGVDYLPMAKFVEHLITRRSAWTVLRSWFEFERVLPVFW
jgi:hypothetical protein